MGHECLKACCCAAPRARCRATRHVKRYITSDNRNTGVPPAPALQPAAHGSRTAHGSPEPARSRPRHVHRPARPGHAHAPESRVRSRPDRLACGARRLPAPPRHARLRLRRLRRSLYRIAYMLDGRSPCTMRTRPTQPVHDTRPLPIGSCPWPCASLVPTAVYHHQGPLPPLPTRSDRPLSSGLRVAWGPGPVRPRCVCVATRCHMRQRCVLSLVSVCHSHS